MQGAGCRWVQGAGAGCRCRCRCRVQVQGAGAGCRCRVQVQGAGAGCRCRVQVQGAGAGGWDENNVACCGRRHRRSDRAPRADSAGVGSEGGADGGSDSVAQASGLAGDLARRPMGRLHGARDELGRERVRNRNLAGRHGERRERGRTSADEREEVEPVARVGAGWLQARIRVGPDRQAADLPDQSACGRSRGADLGRRRHHQLRVGA